jgi:uncharacterized membrane protein
MRERHHVNAIARLVVLVVAAADASACAYETLEQHACPTEGTQLTYDNFGRHFIDTYCQSCHGSTSVNRQGAPGEYIFDTQAQIQHWAARIYVRAASTNDSMPPGPADPPLAERNQLADWLACGAH